MICAKCKTELSTGMMNGIPVWYCPPPNGCGGFFPRPVGLAVYEGTDSPEALQASSPVNLEPTRGISDGEARFAELWNEAHPDYPFRTEYMFHSLRGWRLDFAWPAFKVAVEFEGFGHGKPNRYAADVPKYNALAFRGWRLFRCTKDMLRKDSPNEFIEYVFDCLLKETLR